MIEQFHQLLRWSHIAVGFVGLAVFWVPVFTRKGSARHKRFGKVFAACAYYVSLSAVLGAALLLLDLRQRGVAVAARPDAYGILLFLAYLGLASFVMVHHGVRVIATRRAPRSLRTPFHRALALGCFAASAGIVAFGLLFRSGVSMILVVLSSVGFFLGFDIRRYLRSDPGRWDWLYQHMNAMLSAGIAFHTAFAVFGAARLFHYRLEGLLGLLPWILPATVGTPTIAIWTRHYRRKLAAPEARLAGVQA